MNIKKNVGRGFKPKDDFCPTVRKLKHGEMYDCLTASSFINYNWHYTENNMFCLLCVSIYLLEMIMKSDFPLRKKLYENIELHDDAENQSAMDNLLHRVLEKV